MASIIESPSRLPGWRGGDVTVRENKDNCFDSVILSILSPLSRLLPLPRPIDPLNEISCPAGRRHAEISWSRVGFVYLCLRFSIETASPVSMVIPGYEAARKINGTKSSQPVVGRK